MAITPLQERVLRTIAKNRSPESHVAGGTALNLQSERLSGDIDIFHDIEDAVSRCVTLDAASLREAGFSVEITPHGTGFVEGLVTDERGETTQLQWAFDAAMRFFPVVQDPVFGYRLHVLDLAVNKVLALAGRRELRDYHDVVRLHHDGMPLAALAWAAPAKDPGFTPDLIIDEINRHSNYPEDVLWNTLLLPTPPDPRAMKRILLEASREARDLFEKLPAAQVGHLYLDHQGRAVLPDPAGVREGRLTLHGAVIRGAWPVLPRGS